MCVMEQAKNIAFFALPDPLLCSAMNKNMFKPNETWHCGTYNTWFQCDLHVCLLPFCCEHKYVFFHNSW